MVIPSSQFKIKNEHEKFFWTSFKSVAMKFIANRKNYNTLNQGNQEDTLICRICHQKIEDHSYPDHFLIWTRDSKNYLCFHFKCALKNNHNNFGLKLENFDYFSPI